MIYLSAPPANDKYPALVRAGIGLMITPLSWGATGKVGQVAAWAADNGCFSQGAAFNLSAYLDWLAMLAVSPAHDTCLFAVAPDVLCDAGATWERSAPVLPKLRALGYRAALVAQNGMEHMAIDWDSFDALFIGGDTAWKLGPAARSLSLEAKARGKWLHMARVNSRRRILIARQFGCDSVDGTMLAFRPDGHLPAVRSWLHEVAAQTVMWEAA